MQYKARHCPTNTGCSAGWYRTQRGGAYRPMAALARGCRSARAAVLAVLLAAPAVVSAESNGEPGDTALVGEATGFELVASADFVYFDYREFDRSGRELNHEYGPLPGIRLSARTRPDPLFARFDLSFHGGEVNYDGATQVGSDFRSETDTRLFSFGAEIGRWRDPDQRRWGGFVRLARRIWGRDIQGRGNVDGLFEEYRWSEVGVGLRRAWPRSEGVGWNHELAASVFAVVDGTIFVDLSGLEGVDWDDTTLDLGNATGLRLRWTSTRELAGGGGVRIAPYYSFWSFGRSNTEQVTSDGQPVGRTVTEPESESQRLGVTVGWVF